MKDYIKALVKESLGGILKEKSKTPEKEGKKKKKAVEKNLDANDQESIKIAAASNLAPPESHIMVAAGLGNKDDASDRADFNHQLHQTHGRGFDEKDAAKVSKVLTNLNLK